MPSTGIRVGSYRHRVSFYSYPNKTRTATGQISLGAPVLVGTYWANVRTVSAKESMVAGQLRIEAEYAIDMRYVAGLDTTMTATWAAPWGAVSFNLVSVRDPDSLSRKTKLSLFAKVIKDA